MRLYVVLRYVGLTLLVTAGFMLASLGVSLYYGDAGFVPLLFSTLITAFVGLFPIVFVPRVPNLSNKEGYLVVVLTWIFVCFFGAIPYALYGGEFDLSGAWFESVSGFTTTGASMLNNIEGLPNSILFWRALTHWFGGVGVVVFALVVLPSMGRAQMTLSRSEVSSMARQDFHYRSKKMLRVMATVYLGLTVTTVGGLLLCGIPLFDSVCLSFATVATGGFAVTNLSIASYANVSAEMWLVVMMFLSSVHFGLLFAFISGRVKSLFRAPAVRFFTVYVTGATLLIAINLYGIDYGSILSTLRYSVFQVVSVVSTTGFATADASLWPPFSLMLLIFLSLVGGCSGSTAGGMKADRVLIMIKAFKTSFKRQQHPHALIPVKVGRYSVTDSEVYQSMLFLLLFLSVILLSTLLLTLFGFDVITGLSASATCMSNVGPSLGAMGFFDSYSAFVPAAKILLSVVMLLGRLELFGLLLIFFRSSWK